jgi:ABC-2 type transport system permease protein
MPCIDPVNAVVIVPELGDPSRSESTAGAAVSAALVWMLTSVNLAFCPSTALPALAVLGLAFVSFSAVVSLTVRKFSGAAMLSMMTAVVAWFLSAAFGVDQSVGGLLAADRGWLVMGAYAVVFAAVAWLVYRRRLGGGR